MFDDCVLITEYCSQYVDKSSNRAIAADTMALSHVINETLDRYLIPFFINILDHDSHNSYEDIGFVDIRRSEGLVSQNTMEKIQKTYLMFKRTFNVDMLEVLRIKPYLLPIVEDFIDG